MIEVQMSTITKKLTSLLPEVKHGSKVKLGFDSRACGMGSREYVVFELDRLTLEWEKENPKFKPGPAEDDIEHFAHIGIGGEYYCGFRRFRALQK
jgi:hypothetical protein